MSFNLQKLQFISSDTYSYIRNEGCSKGSRINMHLSQDLLEIVSWPVDWMRVNPFISCYHNTFISGLALHLFLHIAPLVSALIVASARRKLNNWWSKWSIVCTFSIQIFLRWSMYIPCMENMHIPNEASVKYSDCVNFTASHVKGCCTNENTFIYILN